MTEKGRRVVRKPATKLPHLQKKLRKNAVPRDRVRSNKRIP